MKKMVTPVRVTGFEQRLMHYRFGQRVERAVGLVEQQNGRIVDQRADNFDPAAQAGRNIAGIFVFVPAQARHRPSDGGAFS